MIHFGKWWLQLLHRDRPVPLSKLLFLRKLIHVKDALFPDYKTCITSGKNLHNLFLASYFENEELGAWSLTTDTLNFLEQQINILKPKLILEFSSGISTACLAQYMCELHGYSNQVYVISIEQEMEFAQKTRKLLEALKLEKYAQVFCCPLREQMIENIPTYCYDISAKSLITFLRDNPPDFILIDGPSGSEKVNTRFGTLPLIRSFSHTRVPFFLDDALRDKELTIAHLWNQLPYVEIQGICLWGKGLLLGRISKDV